MNLKPLKMVEMDASVNPVKSLCNMRNRTKKTKVLSVINVETDSKDKKETNDRVVTSKEVIDWIVGMRKKNK